MNATEHPTPDIRCMNVKFSPNLGDGLLSECLEAALIAHGAGSGTRSVDLAARTRYGQRTTARGAMLRVLDALPKPLRQGAVRLPLALQSARKWGPHYAENLAGADAMVLGGGNLITDLDLNFPTKLALAMQHAERLALPSAIYACGAGGTWSREGLARLRTGFERRNLRAVFLRDAASKEIWDDRMAATSGHEAVVVRDPGLLACETYPQPARPSRDQLQIGLGIMSDIAIRYHGNVTLGREGLGRWYLDLAAGLTARGVQVDAFTNGATEDVEMAAALAPDLAALGVAVRTPADPAALASLIAGYDAVAAYRMHAVIAAYSFGVPAMALAWDAKLESFVASVGREDSLHDPSQLSARDAASLLLTMARTGVDGEMRRAVVAEARRDVGLLLAALR